MCFHESVSVFVCICMCVRAFIYVPLRMSVSACVSAIRSCV